jgi:hypothetical protein
MDQMKLFVLVVGNLSEGFRFIGPFQGFDSAALYAEGVELNSWVATLEAPAEGRGE